MFKDRIFNLAILLSLAWHIFCISIVSIVSPKETTPVKFSKVSFLGPILERGALKVRIEPRERSILEKRYLLKLGEISWQETNVPGYQLDMYEEDAYHYDTKLISMIGEAVAGQKIEPAIAAE